MHQRRTPASARSHLIAGRSWRDGVSPTMNTPGWLSPPSYRAVYTYGTRPAIRGATTSRTAEMCQPATASTTPAETSASTSSATCAGGAPPSTSTSRSSLPSTPDWALTSSAASCAQHSHDGPKIPAGPCNGTTKATSSVAPPPGASPVHRRAFSITATDPSNCLLREYFLRLGIRRYLGRQDKHRSPRRRRKAMTTTATGVHRDLDLARLLTLVE